MTEGLIFDLKRFALHDGPGIRLTVFMKGCPLRCWWCHNPESLGKDSQLLERKNTIGDRVIGIQREHVGQTFTIETLKNEIEKEVVFFDESGGGVTFSGGEPLIQLDFVKAALKTCKQQEIHTCLDTSGFAPFSAFEDILAETDLFLYDIKLLNDSEHKTYTGVSNRTILDNLKRLAATGKKIVVRFPVIPGITDTHHNINALVQMLASIKTIRHISLLPYHSIAESKYQRLGIDNKMQGTKSLTTRDLEHLQSDLQSLGYEVTLGG